MKLRAPSGLRVHVCRIDGEDFAVLDFPLSRPLRPDGLSAAELEVFELIIGGASNREIAERRRTSIRTVANQVASVFAKAKVSSRAELIARRTGRKT
jgi:DNA-binding CsgD family transcriptional regulator